jgi:IclR family transcriptional regulator, pca regulon regulatory protein
MTAPTQERNNSTVKSFAVLELLGKAGVPLSLAEVARAANLNKTTARRFITTLCDLGYVERQDDGGHRLTARVLDLSSMYFRTKVLPSYAMPHLERLCSTTNTTVSLAMLDGTEAVYTARVTEREVLSVGLQIGTRLPAHATAVGKVLLSFLPRNELAERYRDRELTPYTGHTITSLPDLIGAVGEVRRQGFAVSDQEFEPSVWAVACPLTARDGSLIAAVNIAGRADDGPRIEFYQQVLPELLKAAHNIAVDAESNQPEQL